MVECLTSVMKTIIGACKVYYCRVFDFSDEDNHWCLVFRSQSVSSTCLYVQVNTDSPDRLVNLRTVLFSVLGYLPL